MIRLHVLTAALALLGGSLFACNGETEAPGEQGQLTDEESSYLVKANRILADSNAAFGTIRAVLIGVETIDDSAIAPLAERLQELKENAANLEPPTRFSEEHTLLLTALERMEGTSELVLTLMTKGDEDSLADASVQVEEAFDLLKQASAAFIAEARR